MIIEFKLKSILYKLEQKYYNGQIKIQEEDISKIIIAFDNNNELVPEGKQLWRSFQFINGNTNLFKYQKLCILDLSLDGSSLKRFSNFKRLAVIIAASLRIIRWFGFSNDWPTVQCHNR